MTAKLTSFNPELPRDKEANLVQAKFAQFTEELSTKVDRMTGFWVVVFDDGGNPMSAMYLGDMLPLPRPMVPEVVHQCVISDVYSE